LLKKAREDAGLSQVEVATRLKRKQPLVSKFETGERGRLDVSELVEVARAIGADPVKLFAEAIRIVDRRAKGEGSASLPQPKKRPRKAGAARRRSRRKSSRK
jgi:transcriptional regulator with XRE-family HTH domain